MTSLIERAKGLLAGGKSLTAPDFDDRDRWTGSSGYRYKEWKSADGKHLIVVSYCGGPEYDDRSMKDIHLIAFGEASVGSEVMRVQAVLNPDADDIRYNVYLDAITENPDGSWCSTSVCYFHEDGGRLDQPFHQWSYPIARGKYALMTPEEFKAACIADMRANGIYHMDEIPGEIDIEATVVSFIDQIKRQDFSKPQLIAKPLPLVDGTGEVIGP